MFIKQIWKNLARLRYNQRINRELQKLPEYKRVCGKIPSKSFRKVLWWKRRKSFLYNFCYGWCFRKRSLLNVIQNIQSSRDGDIEKFANALSEFGFLEMSIVTNQAINRLKFLDELEILARNPKTLEETMHKALENNLWVLGNEYSLIFSNRTLSTAIKDYLNIKFDGKRAYKRPDLFLGANILREHLLIEFKRPSISVGRDEENQALKYRDDLYSVIHNKFINIMVIGVKLTVKFHRIMKE